MTELMTIMATKEFQEKQKLKKQLVALGISAGDSIMVHSSLSAIGWVAGGAQAAVEALLETVTETGTVVMPAQSPDNSDPMYWMAPPVPEDWHQAIRDSYPAYDRHLSSLRGMGRIAECFHRHPGTIRSMHPAHSFMAWGQHAAEWMSDHPLEDSFGEHSPLGKMMKADVKIVLIGVGFDSCTALHFAEFAQDNRTVSPQGAAMMHNGQRVWRAYDCVDTDSDRFPEIAAAYPGSMTEGFLGQAKTIIIPMKPLVEFGITWLKDHPATKEES
ncbi:aminoglycoside N(3)-acetyltransferase [Planococcus lenghuensis]|uniref:Aminoglycoside N(3)-acetyltransferase n=1 Tax=Planococcus lenghuensis TaxID=2213202 RepID=A0A1Q2L217_9BACL|nr:AAC(3) family N-acetyltransferase [Planococcus lenghuensis]AQQ54471.1 AAC(3) family N-acetyltransferase [Planococcus lenghuensis]